MTRYYYEDTVIGFCEKSHDEILGKLTSNNEFSSERSQIDAWIQQINVLKSALSHITEGHIFFEYSIPRMGKRIDVLLIVGHVIFILEFKVGEKEYLMSALDQVWDYALDLKHFHETSHTEYIIPILIATNAKTTPIHFDLTTHGDLLLFPIKSNGGNLHNIIEDGIRYCEKNGNIAIDKWKSGRYAPTPTIIEAAMALYKGHGVQEITRTDASAENLSLTSTSLSEIILDAKQNNKNAICIVTGVPGAGKTLVGLDIATKHLDKNEGLTSVFLSGNGPLVAVLREALTRDKVKRIKEQGKKIKKGDVMSEVKMFIQNVHHYRDEYLKDEKAPFDHVAIFDEAQRAWNLEQTVNFMSRKKGIKHFHMSEPEFLISCLNRHQDWAVVVCLVGGGQEINTGEAGISEWINAINRTFSDWHIHVSDKLHDTEYAAGKAIQLLQNNTKVTIAPQLHLSVSLRSFRTEDLSYLVKSILDLELEQAKHLYQRLKEKYPIVLTRDIGKAKKWVKQKARGSERYGMIVSSQAQRLKPHAIDVKTPIDPIHWFLDDKDDVRSSYYLEDVATEFQVQGLELDWTCVTWDGDFRHTENGWEHCSFVGNKWQKINKLERKQYQKNAYRVLLTRARQGMVIVVPEGNSEDPTRDKKYYDGTYSYLESIGIKKI